MALLSTTIGASKLLWGADSPRDLGTTVDGGKFIYEVDLVNRCSHNCGTTPYEICVVGRDVRIEAMLFEYTVENLLLALGSTTSVSEPLNSSNKTVEVTAADGTPLSADRLILRPINATDYQKDIVLWKSCVLPSVTFVTQVQQERIYKVTFRALIDEDEIGRKRLARLGDYQIIPSYH